MNFDHLSFYHHKITINNQSNQKIEIWNKNSNLLSGYEEFGEEEYILYPQLRFFSWLEEMVG